METTPLFRTTLPNGMRLVVQPIPGLRSATVVAAVRGGTRYESRETNGLAHFQEHMFFRGGERYRNEFEVGAAIDGVGGSQNAYTSYEQVGYYAHVPSSSLALGIDLLSDMLMNARFNPDDIDKERGPVLQEIAFHEDSPFALAGDAMDAIFHDGSSPLSWRILGPAANVRRFGRQDFISFAERFYTADNTVLAVAGGVTPQAVLGICGDYFADMPPAAQRPPKRASPAPYVGESRIAYWPIDREQMYLLLRFKAPGVCAPQSRACKVLATALGGGLSSRLFIEVRSERGLAYATGARYDKESDDSAFLDCYAGVAPERVCEGVAALVSTCRSMVTRPDAEEVARAKRNIRGKREIGVESEATAVRLAEQELLHGGADELDDYISRHDEVTPDEVTALSEEMFHPDQFRLAISGPVAEEMVDEIRRTVSVFKDAPASCVKPTTDE